MDKPNKILIVQLKRAGDVIVTTPVLPSIRNAFPQAKIDFLVDKPFAVLLENNPYINRVQIFDRKALFKTWRMLRAASYDWIIDFQSSPRSILAGLYSGAPVRAGYQVSFWGNCFSHSIKRPGGNLSVTDGKMNLVRFLIPDVSVPGERKIFLNEAERSWAAAHMAESLSEKEPIGLVPTHRRPSRRWPVESFVKLGGLLSAQGHPLWLFWGPGERDYVLPIQRRIPGAKMIPDSSLRQMAALLERCGLVITNDNGPMHLAVAVGTPTITVYGPTDPVSWNPGGSRHKIMQATGLTCLGCNLNACPFGHECMTQLTPEEIFEAAAR